MAWSQSPTDTTAENSGELGSNKAVLGLEVEQERVNRQDLLVALEVSEVGYPR
jgi:hypothetical protein